ncbi:MAG: hypothetical protein AAF089_17285 [Bacteroidota bacterium]
MLPFRFSTLFALLLAFVALPLAGCDSSDDGDSGDDAAGCPTANQASGTFTANAGGSTFDAVCIQVITDGGVFNITGIENVGQTGNSNQEFLSISITNAATGQYSPPFGAIVAYSRNQNASTDPNNTYAGLSGTVNLTEFTAGSAKGTFTVTVQNNNQDQIQISSGSFDVTF